MRDPTRPSDRRVQTMCMLILTLIAIGIAMAQLRPVLVPFVLALFFTQCLSPLIGLQIKHLRFPRWLAVTIATLVGLGLMTGAGFLVAASVGKLSQNLPLYRQGLDKITHGVVDSRAAHWLGVRPDASSGRLLDIPADATYSFLKTLVGETTNVISIGATVVLLMAFLLYGHRTNSAGSAMLDEIDQGVQRYIRVTIGISTLTGLLVGVTLAALGVEFAAVFGFLAFLLNFIPNIGAIFATLLPLPIVLLSPHNSLLIVVLALAIPGAMQVAIGSLVQPKLLGNSLNLHPVVLLLSLLFFSMIWGVPGAFLATPVTAVIRIVLEKIPSTRPLAAVLAGNLVPLTQAIERPVAEEMEAEWDAAEVR